MCFLKILYRKVHIWVMEYTFWWACVWLFHMFIWHIYFTGKEVWLLVFLDETLRIILPQGSKLSDPLACSIGLISYTSFPQNPKLLMIIENILSISTLSTHQEESSCLEPLLICVWEGTVQGKKEANWH